MKRIPLLVSMLMLLVGSAGAQTDWKTYTVTDEHFSVALPAVPSMEYRRMNADSRGVRLEISLGSFGDGVVYMIHVFENLSPRQSLDSFIKDRESSGRSWNRKSRGKRTVDGASGKTFSFDGTDGAVQFFSKGDRLYQFAAVGAPENDARLTKFFSSISLVDRKDSVEVSHIGPPPLESDTSSSSDTTEKIYTRQEVDKNFKPVMNFHPQYTEAARQQRVTGTVVLQCTLAADGNVRSIRVISGLPHGLTENAIQSARKLKFIPAMKDGKYVSVSTQFVFKFDLF